MGHLIAVDDRGLVLGDFPGLAGIGDVEDFEKAAHLKNSVSSIGVNHGLSDGLSAGRAVAPQGLQFASTGVLPDRESTGVLADVDPVTSSTRMYGETLRLDGSDFTNFGP